MKEMEFTGDVAGHRPDSLITEEEENIYYIIYI
jgi:hypothetical protein